MSKQARTMYDDIQPPSEQPAGYAPKLGPTVAGSEDSPPKTVLPESNWQPIVTAPRTGAQIEVTEDIKKTVGSIARWHTTREMRNGKWTPVSRWVAGSLRVPLLFDPVGWRPYDGA